MRGMVSIISALCAMALCVSMSSCSLDDSQIKVVAQNAGLFSAVGWIAVDNPDASVVAIVSGILDTVSEKAGGVSEGKTYTEVLYPEIEKFIDSDAVLPQYRPICKAGSISLLGGIDILFAANPQWKEKQDLAIQVVQSFVIGAKGGLAMSDSDPVLQAARAAAARRARIIGE